MQDLRQFFASKHFIETREDGTYDPMQLGANIQYFLDDTFDWDDADIVIVGCGDQSGEDTGLPFSNGPNAIREQLYKMYGWHTGIKIADAGNILQGARQADTRAALRTVLHELEQAGKIVILLGGAHDLTLQQYYAFKKSEKVVNVAVADMLIDMEDTEGTTASSFLMDMLTEQPSFIRHYSHMGFQSYYVHPKILETLDKLRFDFFRVGKVREHIEDMEPVLRASDLFSFDISAIKFSSAPSNREGSPNGFEGDEACLLARYAGMSDKLSSFGLYGYKPEHDISHITAKQLAQMIWYFVDGYYLRKTEADLTDEDEFLIFSVTFTENDTVFLKSKRTNRWWMKLPTGKSVPCSYEDYQIAANGDIPERWLREQERLV
ncbi:MAG: formimidoylglutamase [Chitinophagales bacterium]|nr:formimidoylglutamase [Chitinophagaceae bacterium]MCB9063850.1 formimidoylglutamase [Chitinophagales bacterium]